jgi:hypothetical protein
MRHIWLRKWFPPNDPVAIPFARLCILREDLFLEFQASIAEDIDALDGNSAIWRKIYFFRKLSGTLFEIRSAVETLQQEKIFKMALSKWPSELQGEFKKFVCDLSRAHDLIKNLRHAVGGHVLHKDVKKALDTMDSDRKGLIEIGRTRDAIHYKFSAELIMAILLAGVPNSDQLERIKEITEQIVQLVASFIEIIDAIIAEYADERGLIEN